MEVGGASGFELLDRGLEPSLDVGGDLDHLVAAARQAGITIEKLLLTHGHVDHAGGAALVVVLHGIGHLGLDQRLAQRTAGAAKEVKQLIEESTEKVAAGNRLTEGAKQTMNEALQSVVQEADLPDAEKG